MTRISCRPSEPPHRALARAGIAVGAVSFALALAKPGGPAAAQYIDARLIPKGALRIDFSPHYTNYNTRFSFGTPGLTDGTPEPLGTDLTADTVGSNLFPALASAESAMRAVIRDALYRINVGSFNTIRDADVRHFPFGFTLGLSKRLTVRANIPIVTTRSQVTFTSDSTDANVGLNLATPEFGDATTVNGALALIDQLEVAVTDVQAAMATGSFGCPGSAACTQAAAVVTRAAALRANLEVLTGLGTGQDFVPFAPLAGSVAGAAITAEIAAVLAELEALGASPFTGSLVLPDARLGPDGIESLLTRFGSGFEAEPIDFNRQTKFGDIEVGARFGVVATRSVRLLLTSTLRLPTGRPANADNFVDIGTGDGQTDVEVGFEGALEPGSAVGVSFGTRVTLQLPHNLVRRIGPPESPLVPLSRRVLVSRNLGNVIQASAFPTLRLTDEFRVFGSINYYRKASDAYEIVALGDLTANPPSSAEPLQRESAMQAWSFGAGIAYRSDQSTAGRVLPIEAGVNYRSAFSGTGGLTPKTNSVQLYLRLFYDLFLETTEDEP